MELPPAGHEPVMLHEVLELLRPQSAGRRWSIAPSAAADMRWRLGSIGADGLLIGLDADPRNLEFAAGRLKGLECQVRLFQANFAKLSKVLAEAGNPPVNGILADLGSAPTSYSIRAME